MSIFDDWGIPDWAGYLLGGAMYWLVDTMLDAAQPELGKAQTSPLTHPTADEGIAVPELLGTSKMTGNFIWHGLGRSREHEKDGAFAGYRYYLSWALGLSQGPVDKLYAIYCDDSVVWSNDTGLDRPGSGVSELTIDGAMSGTVNFYWGTDDQSANSVIGSQEGTSNNPPYRRTCYAFFDDCKLGAVNRVPAMRFVMGRTPTKAFSASDAIGYDYNPAHAIYHILVDQLGLDAALVDTTTFAAVATTLYNESRGISVLMDRAASAISYIESILYHIDAQLRYSGSGKIELVLLRADQLVVNMPVVGEDDLLEQPSIERPDLIDCSTAVKLTYTKRSTMPANIHDAGLGARDLALTRLLGRQVVKPAKLPLFTTFANANWAAWRLLRIESSPLVRASLTLDRSHFRLQPGDPFVLNYSPNNISGMVFRAAQVEEAELSSERIVVSAVEDPWFLGQAADAESGEGLAEMESTELLPLNRGIAIEAWYPHGPGIIPAAARRTGTETGYGVYISNDGTNYSLMGTSRAFAVYGQLKSAYVYTYRIDDKVGFEVEITQDVDRLESVTRAEMISGMNLALIGSDGNYELISFQNVTSMGSNRYKIENIRRALYDDDPLWFDLEVGDDFYYLGNAQELSHPLVSYKTDPYLKFVPFDVFKSGGIDDAAAIDVGMGLWNRPTRPFRPTCLAVNGRGSNAYYYNSDNEITWRPRTPGSGAGVGNPEEVIDREPKWDGYFQLEISAWVIGSLRRIYKTVEDAASYTYTYAEILSDWPSLPSDIMVSVYHCYDETHKSRNALITMKKGF